MAKGYNLFLESLKPAVNGLQNPHLAFVNIGTAWFTFGALWTYFGQPTAKQDAALQVLWAVAMIFVLALFFRQHPWLAAFTNGNFPGRLALLLIFGAVYIVVSIIAAAANLFLFTDTLLAAIGVTPILRRVLNPIATVSLVLLVAWFTARIPRTKARLQELRGKLRRLAKNAKTNNQPISTKKH